MLRIVMTVTNEVVIAVYAATIKFLSYEEFCICAIVENNNNSNHRIFFIRTNYKHSNIL